MKWIKKIKYNYYLNKRKKSFMKTAVIPFGSAFIAIHNQGDIIMFEGNMCVITGSGNIIKLNKDEMDKLKKDEE